MKTFFYPAYLFLSIILFFSACTNDVPKEENKNTSKENSKNNVDQDDLVHEVRKEATKDFNDPFQAKTQKNTSKFIDAPYAASDIPNQRFKINPNKAQKIAYQKTGSTIHFPAHAFVDKNGAVVEEIVEIDYREFHTAADIILSGIPMKYDSAGVSYNFETAGMFEIRGYKKNGEAVFIHPDKDVQVDMVSFNADQKFNFYYLNEKEENWNFIQGPGKIKSTPIKAKKKSTGGLSANSATIKNATKPVKPVRLDPRKQIWNFENSKLKYLYANSLAACVWQPYGDTNSFNPNKNDLIKGTQWDDIKIDQFNDEAFNITLRKGKKIVHTKAQAVFMGAIYEDAIKNYNKDLENYKEIMASANARNNANSANQRANNSRNIRSANVRNFGVYNHDRYSRSNDVITLNTDFQIKDFEKNGFVQKLILISGDQKNIVVNYNGGGTQKNFKYIQSEKNCVVALLNNRRIATMTMEEFKSKIPNKSTKEVAEIDLGKSIAFESAEDLDQIIKNL